MRADINQTSSDRQDRVQNKRSRRWHDSEYAKPYTRQQLQETAMRHKSPNQLQKHHAPVQQKPIKPGIQTQKRFAPRRSNTDHKEQPQRHTQLPTTEYSKRMSADV